jgi:hypothetical protein
VTISGAHFTQVSSVFFGNVKAAGFTVDSESSITAVSPAGEGAVDVNVWTAGGSSARNPGDVFTYLPLLQKVEYKSWVLGGSLTDKKLGQAVQLPQGATFTGSSEINNETRSGAVNGGLSIPAFAAPLKLFGVVPVSLGAKLTEVGPLEGALANSETVPGDLTLTIAARLSLQITSISLLGLKIPTDCATAEPIALNLSSNITHEELFSSGWSFAGAAVLPPFRCEDGVFGAPFNAVLTALLSGPENPYSISFRPQIFFKGLRRAVTCIAGPLGGGQLTSYGLSWEPATDYVAPGSPLVYNIYQATKRGGENFAKPTYTTTAGAEGFETPPLPEQSFYFVVRARDQAGHEDKNTVEKEGENLCL